MTIIVLERVAVVVRGELSRWMIEPRACVFVGRPSALVRDKLWDLICEKTTKGAGLLIYTADTEQGFAIRTFGDTRRAVIDFEGLLLIRA